MLHQTSLNRYPLSAACNEIIEIAMDVHKSLGSGFDDSSYKEAFSKRLKSRRMSFEREKRFGLNFNGLIMDQQFSADFVIDDQIIVEVRSIPERLKNGYVDVLEQLVVTKPKLGLTINFYEEILQFKQVLLMEENIC
ncbi:hypothetical protein DHW03_07255 [Pedobacter yonginense]|uniref:GxxExxY protein n=1 Tax=Pedobacter yonginense TaxID=651869 RepID=A0A317ELB8_9SPHI|nr:GxxExxY protein [Pedobacter yonginense]PWS27402.1 hypothetical protein DHW03_07255 [Pedobacter yonginense]